MNRTVFVYVFDTMADWEIGFLTAELNSGRYFRKDVSPIKVVTLGVEKNYITTMGGLRILPDIDLKECNIKETDALILPGGETWMETNHQLIISLVKQCIEKNIIVAAICGATMALAQNGLLDSRSHTSNDLGYLKMMCPNYTGENHYIQQSAITDGKLITATGIAPLEFTLHVLKTLDVILPEALDAWYNLYITHEQKYLYKLNIS
ncbi:type 1 glutamine amidotransferase family protein [Desulfosporosinus hippei]|uniref:Putative intracellular protease/amidase n=1 Tax=Desulfosporosinus hippei DSM 8344 TaxID=1121419 RepID=A0A1G8KK62_9FIRM|nr:type 1 glutamine amidotransferase family protein [Desulfosporosinus hippei]SDI43789.1 Putative intracellular protease/amidase [Desulfosporosinus hippei DSM 8344]